MERFSDLCEFFYNAHHIPVYIYRKGEMAVCFPQQPASCCPDSDFDDYIRDSQVFYAILLWKICSWDIFLWMNTVWKYFWAL